MQRPLSTAQKIYRRHASSTAQARSPKAAPAGGTLPPQKLRALISIYHQADTFITPENLSRRIDEAFIPSLRDDKSLSLDMFPSSMAHFRELGMIVPNQLRDALEEQRKAPKVMEPDKDVGSPGIYDSRNTGTWSGERKGRERKVMEALYGVEGVGSVEVLPGLDVLLEERERMEKDIKADEDGQDGH
ncbi:hypothetical protein M378DRAFT_157353 [Amanita muscaria Koide BX008]|uniref:Uncharacterized protein n=1 Tax=Amanita muscaria (strain Koide BX008) TaxID=946122 RepID=A0A0C2TPK0_AMAMK|nr:hypothetical protein M378DRAFT_157353 [Amanita muscaria Koide BX008]